MTREEFEDRRYNEMVQADNALTRAIRDRESADRIEQLKQKAALAREEWLRTQDQEAK